MEQFIKILEQEMSDLDALKEMSHDDLCDEKEQPLQGQETQKSSELGIFTVLNAGYNSVLLQ